MQSQLVNLHFNHKVVFSKCLYRGSLLPYYLVIHEFYILRLNPSPQLESMFNLRSDFRSMRKWLLNNKYINAILIYHFMFALVCRFVTCLTCSTDLTYVYFY